MNHHKVISKLLHFFILVLQIFIFSGFQPSIQLVEIILKDEPLAITPKEFYIAGVIDQREDQTAVAWLLPVANKVNGHYKPYPVDLQGGCAAAVKRFIDRNLLLDQTLRPVVINIKKYAVNEHSLADGRIEGHVQLFMSFELADKNDDPVQLVNYDGKSNYIRSSGLSVDIEPLIRHLLANGLLYLNNWMNAQAESNIKLAKAVKVTFNNHHEQREGDSIYYAVNRPLKWSDFQSKVSNSRFDAEVFPVFGYEEHTAIIKGVVVVRLDLKVCLPKSGCLVKPGHENDYTLNHEQRHFDIEKIIAEQFMRKIAAENLPVNNFDGSINVDYLESLIELDKMQKKYDGETNHGSDEFAQCQWNEWIDSQLKSDGVK